MGLKSWYEAHVLPRMIRCACGAPAVAEKRALVVPLAEGRVFELGCGGGINQGFYDKARVSTYAGIDPGVKLLDYARQAARANGWADDVRQGVGEAIPFDDGSFDTVVCTYTLCSVSDPAKTLAEMRRILRPGGSLLYLEHGRAPDADVARRQGKIEPWWKPMMGNCHLTREVGGAIAAAGFAVAPLGAEYVAKMPRWAGWTEWGRAVKPA